MVPDLEIWRRWTPSQPFSGMPDRYRNLTVRIAGYSEYFCSIGEAQQDEIIARTEYESMQ